MPLYELLQRGTAVVLLLFGESTKILIHRFRSTSSYASTRISVFSFRPATNVHPRASEFKSKSGFLCWVLPRAMERAGFVSPQNLKTRNWPSFDLCLGHFSRPCLSRRRNLLPSAARLPGGHGQRGDSPEHAPKQSPSQMRLGTYQGCSALTRS